jgi:hypothetical protein
MYKSLLITFLGSLLMVAAMGGAAAAQYQPIPNFTGIGAGFNFRQAINQRFSGAQPIAPQFVGLPFASLPAEQNGMLLWCKDCQATAPCSAGGAGAWARGARGAWSCAIDALEQDLNANGHNIIAASSVKADQPGDPQYRELLVPGNGIAVGNGATAPFTVVDESANISGHLDGAINVKAPPYLAKGDGATDDTAAIQAAVNASCGASGSNKPEVYLPATPGGLCYKTTSPILINCPTKFNGGGWQQTKFCQNYYGPTLIVQGAETGWKPPLTTNVSVTWASSTRYSGAGVGNQFVGKPADIVDTNGNVEVQTFYNGGNGCTSGSGSHPSWPTSPVGTTTADNNCVWVLATTGGSKTIASGAGASLDAADPEFFNGANYGLNNATAEIMNPGNLEGFTNGLAAFTVEFYVEVFYDDSAGGNLNLFQISPGQPEPNNTPGMRIFSQGNGCTGGSNCLRATADIGGSGICVGCGAGYPGKLTEFGIHHVAVTYDGTTLRLFIDGVLADSHAASGSWTIPPFESMEWADQSASAYPGGSPTQSLTPAFYDSIRISNYARYTANFTPPTAKFAPDANTVFLENFPTTAPTGTIEGYSGTNGGTNVFIPIETSHGSALVDPVYIGNMMLSDNGIYANWMLNSTIENIQEQGAGRTCINLNDNDYQDTISRAFCQIVPFAKSSVGFFFGNQANNNLYNHLQCVGQYSCVGALSGSGHYIMPDFTDEGFAAYPFYFVNSQAILDSPELDVEDSAPNQLASVYSFGAYAPIVINGGQLLSGATGQAYLAINGGAPFLVNGTDFIGGSPAELLNVITNPSSPVVLRDVTRPSGLASTNTGKSWWLSESLGGQDRGVKFADLPASVTNGVRRYCIDCDPPANPPVACTSTGARTGAWVNGLNNAWICVP